MLNPVRFNDSIRCSGDEFVSFVPYTEMVIQMWLSLEVCILKSNTVDAASLFTSHLPSQWSILNFNSSLH